MRRSLRGLLALLLMLLLALGAAAEGGGQLARGAKGEAVEALQARLIELGYLDGAADGDFGPKTERAVAAFQAAAGLTETGVADAGTQEALFSAGAPVATLAPRATAKPDPTAPPRQSSGAMVWIPRTGKRYHSDKNCSGMKDPSYVSIEEAVRLGFTPCKKCYS